MYNTNVIIELNNSHHCFINDFRMFLSMLHIHNLDLPE